MNDYENAIEIKGITKRYDGFTLDNVSFDVPKGSIMGFIGQNGAGKTTTINTLLNIVKKDAGEIKLLGFDHEKDEFEAKKYIAAVFDELPFDDRLNAIAIDKILREIYEEWSADTFFGYLDRFALPRKKKFGKFSKGMKMKLQIAAALSHNAKLLVMDEATTGLDPVVRSEILDIFLEYLQNEEHTILMSSHITSDLDKVADSVTFIDKGKIMISGYKDDILDTHGVLKCTKNEYKDIDPEDIISARINDFGADVLISDRARCAIKYSGAVIDRASLEDIMIYYVNRAKKEWR
ncbi:ABC transporter ATP-binding protein [Ruminococcus flavefaciens]|uniref:ABC transporter ATP-binding protein n=1 Tax=Ruminococcus flavefaciens TaxID=1265 RepID=UPI00031148A1|nr:ABC transporter ATP-binding protein [Ruminococcus flavefaciens]